MGEARLHRIGATMRADVLATLVVGTAIGFGTGKAAEGRVPPHRALDATAYVLLALAAVTVPLRRRAPPVTLAVASAAVGAFLALGYPHGPIALTVMINAFTVAVARPLRRAAAAVVPAAAVFVAAAEIGDRRLPTGGGGASDWLDWLAAVAMSGLVLVPGLIGALVRRSRVYAARAEEEARRLDLERERLRVAREVHDVVGHSLSIISLQAGVALHVLERRPEQAQVALDAIRRTSLDALDELRATLALTRAGARRPDSAGQPSAPAVFAFRGAPPAPDAPSAADAPGAPGAARVPLTGLARLDGLLGEVRMCGVPVELVTTGRPRALPADVDLAAYRIVQESLTNVMRHAAPARASVNLGYEPDRLVVEVLDEPAAPRASGTPRASGGAPARPGHGLTGLAERVGELGGSLAAGPRTPDHEVGQADRRQTAGRSRTRIGNPSSLDGDGSLDGCDAGCDDGCDAGEDGYGTGRRAGWRVHASLPLPKR
jgi:signal transduction histidine kinase